MNPDTFLRGLWGQQPPGLIQIWTLADKRTRCLTDPAQAADLAGHVDVYTAVCTTHASLDSRERAKGDQLRSLTGLWLDIDVAGGPHDHGAPDLDSALRVARACAEPTVLVATGHGIHAWHLFRYPWMLATRDQRNEAQRASTSWYALHRQAAQADGWDLDQSTRDLTRVLRLPGTRNGKTNPPVPVDVHDAPGVRHDRRDLFDLAGQAPTADIVPINPVQIQPTDLVADERLQLLFDADPDLEDLFLHRPARDGWSLSEYDMAIAGTAAPVMTDQQLADLIVAHRLHHDPQDAKCLRLDYLRRTVARARAPKPREQAQQSLAELAAQSRLAA